MRVTGRKLLNTQVTIRGYITWIYDCVYAGGPGGSVGGEEHEGLEPEKIAARQKLIDEDPMRCWRPHFYMGDAANTPVHQSIWVVEVPREWREDEWKSWKRLPDEMKADNPPPVVVPHAVGDEVVVTGKWSMTSPKGFANSDGLLVYERMENLTNPAPPPEEKAP